MKNASPIIMEYPWNTFSNKSSGCLDELFSKPGNEDSCNSIDLPSSTVSQCLNSVLDDYLPIPNEPVSFESLPSLCKTKRGSKETQFLISKSSPEGIERIVHIIAGQIEVLMTDLYGNYTCQTLFANCSASQRLLLLEALEPHLINISEHARGTHSLQKLIGLASLPEEEKIYLRGVQGHIYHMSKHPNSTHVVQKLLSVLKNRNALIEELVPYAGELATNKLGLCVVKKCLNHAGIVEELIHNCLVLMQDPYANYAIQNIIEIWGDFKHKVTEAITGRVTQLSVQKFSSNVIEKCLRAPDIKQHVYDELIREGVTVLLDCPFGCYVLKTAVDACPAQLRDGFKTAMELSMKHAVQQRLKPRWDELLNRFEDDN